MNCEEQGADEYAEKNLNEKGALMKVKIQRLEKEDFFVSISGKKLITHLKEKIIAFLQAAQLENDDVALCVSNLRLIYKGKVLLDPKSVEFYKIQNDDTIQLCPTRRRRLGQPESNSAGSQDERTGTQDEDAMPQFGREPGEFTFISFSMSEPPELGRSGSSSIRLPRTRNRGQDASNNTELPNHTPRLRGTTRRRLTMPARPRPTPETVTGTLRSFKFILQDTLRRVNASNVEDRQELIPQLDTLIRRATNLRDDLQMERVPPPFTSRFEFMVFERMGIHNRSSLNTAEEKEDVPRARRRTAPEIPNPMAPQAGLATSQAGSINIDAERRVPSMLRYLPHRLNPGSAFELSLAASRFGEDQVNPPDFVSPLVPAEADNREEQQRNPEINEEVPPPQRNTRSRGIFSSIINRISRR